MNVKYKNSNIEILRLISMYIIVLHHSVLYSGVLKQPLNNNTIFANILFVGGKLGSDIFIAISSYYLVGSKFKIKRALDSVLTIWIYNCIFLIINIFVHFKTIGIKDILEVVFPLSYKAYWFITAYVAILFLSPILNQFLMKAAKHSIKYLIIVLFIMVSLIPTIFPGSNTFLDNSHLLSFVLIYLMVGYYKLQYANIQHVGRKALVTTLVLIALGPIAVITGFLLKNPNIINGSTYWYTGESFFTIISALTITFFAFSLKPRINKIVNLISGGALDVYLIHMNHFIYLWLWNSLIDIKKFFNDALYPLIVLAICGTIFAVCLSIGIIRTQITKIFYRWINNRQTFVSTDIKINKIFSD